MQKNITNEINKKELEFPSLINDTTFKYLWKKESSRKWFSKLIKIITNIDLSEYELYDSELNGASKDYRLDILFVKKEDYSSMNIEMYRSNHEIDHIKSSQYAFRLLADNMKKGEKYSKKTLVQVNFYNGYFKEDSRVNKICYQIEDESGKYRQDYLKIYDIYLLNYKGKCYNEVSEEDAMLSLLTGDNFEELRRIADGNEEALMLVKDLEDLAMEEKFWGVYNAEKENIIMQNSLYEEGHEEGKVSTKIEIAKEMLNNNEDINKISKYTGLTIDEIEKLSKE